MTTEVHPVGQVVRYLKSLIERNQQLADVWVTGEVSDLRLQSSGHMYFSLRDRDSALRCAFFRNRNAGQRDRLQNGASVVIHGGLSLHERSGNLSLIVDFVQPEGTGALAAEFERRRAAFEEAGLFAAERKRPLPAYPQRIAVVTSPSGAALQDVLTVLARRWPAAAVLIQPTVVQGPTAGTAVAEAIRAVGQHAPDVIIVTRGGGSAEDLWAFNEEAVVRAIYAASAPVISAVGHETDTTLADLAADVRAPTPSAAAEVATPDRTALLHRVEGLRSRIELRLTRELDALRETADLRLAVLHRGAPDTAAARERVTTLTDRADRATASGLRQARERLGADIRQLRALSPAQTLARGYTIVEGEDGGVHTATASAAAAGALRLRFSDGVLPVRVSGPAQAEMLPMLDAEQPDSEQPAGQLATDRSAHDTTHHDGESR